MTKHPIEFNHYRLLFLKRRGVFFLGTLNKNKIKNMVTHI